MATVKQGTISTAPVSGSGLSDQDLLDMYRQMVLVRDAGRADLDAQPAG